MYCVTSAELLGYKKLQNIHCYTNPVVINFNRIERKMLSIQLFIK